MGTCVTHARSAEICQVSSSAHLSHLSSLRNHAISFEATEDAAAANDDEPLDDDVAPDGSACFYAAAGRGVIIG